MSGHFVNELIRERPKGKGNPGSVTMNGHIDHQLGGPWYLGAGHLCYRTR